jgi:ABC-type branched-subunit amino acid transport system ATPase component
MPVRLRKLIDRLGSRSPRRPVPSEVGAKAVADGGSGLEVSDLSVRFGGLRAVDGVSLNVPMGQITGLIGPNGAGKTTIFNACSGLNRMYDGTLQLQGRDITRLPPAARGRLGLGRTFQQMELCDTLTVLQNVMLGRESSAAGARFWSQLFPKRGEFRAVQAEAMAALEVCEVADLADERAGNLSTGQARMVEIARLLAGPFDVLLLDEPSSGLDPSETARLATLLERLVEERKVGILLVEHDVGLVLRLCRRISVLDFGELIFEGPAAEVAASPVVRAAYLGDDSVMDAVGDENQTLGVQ